MVTARVVRSQHEGLRPQNSGIPIAVHPGLSPQTCGDRKGLKLLDIPKPPRGYWAEGGGARSSIAAEAAGSQEPERIVMRAPRGWRLRRLRWVDPTARSNAVLASIEDSLYFVEKPANRLTSTSLPLPERRRINPELGSKLFLRLTSALPKCDQTSTDRSRRGARVVAQEVDEPRPMPKTRRGATFQPFGNVHCPEAKTAGSFLLSEPKIENPLLQVVA